MDFPQDRTAVPKGLRRHGVSMRLHFRFVLSFVFVSLFSQLRNHPIRFISFFCFFLTKTKCKQHTSHQRSTPNRQRPTGTGQRAWVTDGDRQQRRAIDGEPQRLSATQTRHTAKCRNREKLTAIDTNRRKTDAADRHRPIPTDTDRHRPTDTDRELLQLPTAIHHN